MTMDSEDAVKSDFTEKRLNYLDAIQRLENLGFDQRMAEKRVCEWEDEENNARNGE
jgi:hypothetical protein